MTTPVVEPTEVIAPVVAAFPANKMLLLGLVGMVGALALLLFQAMHERDELRRAYTAPLTTPQAANGRYDGPVTVPVAEDTATGASSAEV